MSRYQLESMHLLDGGPERLVLDWKERINRLLYYDEGAYYEGFDADWYHLIYRAGYNDYKPNWNKLVNKVSLVELRHLSRRLAPWQTFEMEDGTRIE
jgi:hypothetical protein